VETVVKVDVVWIGHPSDAVRDYVIIKQFTDINTNTKMKLLHDQLVKERKIAVVIIPKLYNRRRLKRWHSERLTIWYGYNIPPDQHAHLAEQIKEQIEQQYRSVGSNG
jgi:dihydroxyacetone kinase-like predicted kinase